MYTRSKSSHKDSNETLTQIGQETNMASPPLTLDDVMAEIKKGNDNTDEKLTKLEEKIDSNQKLITDYIKANDAELKKVKNKVDKVENKLKSTDDTVKGI